MIVRKEKLSPTTSDVNLDCFDSDLSWLQMLPSPIKISQNQSDSQRTKEDKILTWILTRHPIVFDDLSNNQRAEVQLHESRKNNQKTLSNDSTRPTSTTAKLRRYRKCKCTCTRYRNYSGKDLLDAIEEVRSGSMSALKVSRKYGIPSRTLYDKVKKIREQGCAEN